jgi:tetratricopeptide (TPR) repeat protein
MKWRWLIFFAAVTPGAFAGEAENALARGQAARADGVPQAAIYDLEQAAAHATGPMAPRVAVELARCLIASGREREAIKWCRQKSWRNDPGVIFWRAQALAQKGDYAAAFEDYRRAAMDSDLRAEADFGSGRMLEAQGDYAQALAVYAKIPADSAWHLAARLASGAVLIESGRYDDARRLLDGLEPKDRAGREMRRYLLGRIALETNRIDDAANLYVGFEPRDRKVAAGLAIGEADVSLRRDQTEQAEAALEAFVRENPRSALIDQLLAKLDEVRSRQREPSNAALKLWENDQDDRELSEDSTYYLARGDERQGRADRAIRNYAEFIEKYPDQSLRMAATIRLARLLVADGRIDEARKLLASAGEPASRADEAKLRFVRGATEYRAGDYAAAAKTFVRAANLDEGIAESSLANAALSAIAAGSTPLAAEILSALNKQNPATAARIELEQAFARARAGSPDSGAQLEQLANRGGTVGERARLALAEWRWQAGDLGRAREAFIRVANSPAAGTGDQRDYFAVYLADDGSEKAVGPVAEAARDFLERHPDSPRAADVRMKWGEVLMRAGDYRGARVQFEEAGNATSDPVQRQSALYLAARAAAGSMAPEEIDEAIYTLLEAVASQKGGDLAEEARWEQALLQSARHRPEESVKILDSLIASTKDPRMRFAARLKKGEALQDLSATHPERRAEALAEWRAIAIAPDALPAERNEALTHIGAASELAGDPDAALSAYYEALTAPRDRQPEFFWYYKAGFAAAQLLIKQERLKEAVAILEKMAAVPGPRAEEAKEQVKHLRLENFIWED